MKTKQEILTGGSRIVSNTGLWKGKRVLEAMEEYAKQEAIEFAQWLNEQGWCPMNGGGYCQMSLILMVTNKH